MDIVSNPADIFLIISQLSGEADEVALTKESVLKAFGNGLSERSLIKRLFEDKLNGTAEFSDTESILWELHALGNDRYKLATSEYWLKGEDFNALAFEGDVVEWEE